MATEALTLAPPVESVIGEGYALGPVQRPIRREQYLHRFGSHATLMVVEWFQNADGSLRRSVRYVPWPGL
jgi:hypothetical protein